jgi:hypothetical protein
MINCKNNKIHKFKGICMEVEGSRFQGAAGERKLRDEAEDENDESSMDFDDGPSANAFYAVEFSADEGANSTSKIDGNEAELTKDVEGGQNHSKLGELEIHENEGEKKNETVRENNEESKEKPLIERVLFQADDVQTN